MVLVTIVQTHGHNVDTSRDVHNLEKRYRFPSLNIFYKRFNYFLPQFLEFELILLPIAITS